MASVTRDKRSGNWIAKYKEPFGKVRRRSTLTRQKAAALKIAFAWEREALEQAERQKIGLDFTIADALRAYINDQLKGRSSEKKIEQLARDYILPELGEDRLLVDLETPDVERMLYRLQSRLGPGSLNHIRGALSAAINHARRHGLFRGDNVVSLVRSRPTQTAERDFLRLEEIPRFLAGVAEQHRAYCAMPIFTGLRRGEIHALRRSDVDLERRLIRVSKSGERNQTKTGHKRTVPILPPLVPFLTEALEVSDSDFVFPAEDGGIRPATYAAAKIVRRGLRKADLVVGYTHKCRRKGCGYTARHDDAEKRKCLKCNFTLWPSPIDRGITFHHLRHTFATLARQNGVDSFPLMRMLGHRSEKMLERYSHADADFLMRSSQTFIEAVQTVLPNEMIYERFTVRGHQKDTITLAHSLDENDKEKTLDIVEGYVVEPDGIEPTTSGLQSPRSPN
jgi:integrase